MMEAQPFQLNGYTEAPADPSYWRSTSLSSLRLSIREAIARGVTLVLDQERFLRRVTEVIAENTDNRRVAAYVSDGFGDVFVLAAASATAPEWVPARLPITTPFHGAPGVVDSATIFGKHHAQPDTACVVIPLNSSGEHLGAIVLIDVAPDQITTADLDTFAVVAEEIAPAVQVARTHANVRKAIVRDLDTGAYTYDFFAHRLEQEILRARRVERTVTIILIEAVNFGRFEATAGYKLADRTLREIATGLADLMRSSDVVARRGRIGFALLLPDSDSPGAEVAMNRIEKFISHIEARLEDSGYTGPKPGVIAGSATYPVDGDTVAALVLAADQRLAVNDASTGSDE